MAMLMGTVDTISIAGASTIAVNATAVVYTDTFPLKFAEYFGIWIKAASSGTPTVKIQLEEGYDKAVTLNASDSTYVVPEGFADVFSNLNDTLAHVKTLSPVPMKHGRFKITGLAGNPADVVLTFKLFRQERM